MKPTERLPEVLASHVAREEVPGLVYLVSRWHEVEVEAIGSKTAGATVDPMVARAPDLLAGALAVAPPRPAARPTLASSSSS